MKLKQFLTACIISSMMLSTAVYGETGNSSLTFSDEELTEAKRYYDIGTAEWSPERIAYMLRAKNYVKEHCPIPENINTLSQEDYKNFLKQYLDTVFEFLQWNTNDFSHFYESISDIKDHNRVMEILENHIPNYTIFINIITWSGQITDLMYMNFEPRSGELNGAESYQYFYTSPNSYQKESPYFGNTFYGSRKVGGFFDLLRYAQTRDEKYLCSKEFFPDIIDSWQIQERRDTDDHYLSLEELDKRSAEESDLISRQWEAYRNKKYVPIKILMFYNEVMGYPEYVSGYNWYEDDSLNDSLKESIVESFGEEGYAKLLEQVSTAERGKELLIDLSPYWKF